MARNGKKLAGYLDQLVQAQEQAVAAAQKDRETFAMNFPDATADIRHLDGIVTGLRYAVSLAQMALAARNREVAEFYQYNLFREGNE